MRNLSIAFCFVLGAFSARASTKNPLIRVCHADAGQFWIVHTLNQDEVPLCLFNSAGVGAEAFMLYKTNQQVPQSIAAYFMSHQNSDLEQICSDFCAEKVITSDSTANSDFICQFADGSVVEAKTLFLGPGQVETKVLDHALSTTY